MAEMDGAGHEGGEARLELERRMAALRRRRPYFPDRDHPLVSLAEAVVWFVKAPAEAVTLESTARSRRPMGDILENEQEIRADELDRADAAAADLGEALQAAWLAGGQITLDSRDPDQDRLAGAIVSTLVASDFASVQTEELGDQAYRYTVAVDWPRLDAFASQLGLPPVAEMVR